MSPKIKDFLQFIEETKAENTKEIIINQCVERFELTKDRKVFHGDTFAVRFSYSRKGAFSNTILALSVLEKYDSIPFFVVLIKGAADNVVYIANSSFISKISHSSQGLSMSNIKGSFNGSDIVKEYYGLRNEPANFEELFAWHSGIDWHDNLQRIVEATSDIKPQSTRFQPTTEEVENIYSSVERAINFMNSKDYDTLLQDLNRRCEEVKDAILVAAHIENVNIRGRLIEALITSNVDERQQLLTDLSHIERSMPTYDARNGLGDYFRRFDESDTYTDIKTKIIYLNSCPKMFNIDKFLRCMADKNSVFLFYLVGIGENGVNQTALCSVFNPTLIASMHLQTHWAGRSTRGVAQASGKSLNDIMNAKDSKEIDHERATEFLKEIVAL